MTTIKCIAVDDEPLALKLVETFIAQTPFLQLTGSCVNAVEAMKMLQHQNTDLLFLDINMPNLNGMELARIMQLQTKSPTKIIFTTAYNHFAIEGYKVNAIDYLLKPFDYEEFLRAASKAQKIIEDATDTHTTIQEDFIFLKVEYQWVKVKHADILYIESLKDYVKLHLTAPNQSILSLTSLKALEDRLPTSKFMRIHRSYIISLDKISALGKTSLFINKTDIPVGEQYRDTFKNIVDKWIS